LRALTKQSEHESTGTGPVSVYFPVCFADLPPNEDAQPFERLVLLLPSINRSNIIAN